MQRSQSASWSQGRNTFRPSNDHDVQNSRMLQYSVVAYSFMDREQD